MYNMASVAIMAGGAVLNAVAFIGGNYLARVLSGDDLKASIEEKVRHDKALEAYQAAYAKYEKETQHDIKESEEAKGRSDKCTARLFIST